MGYIWQIGITLAALLSTLKFPAKSDGINVTEEFLQDFRNKQNIFEGFYGMSLLSKSDREKVCMAFSNGVRRKGTRILSWEYFRILRSETEIIPVEDGFFRLPQVTCGTIAQRMPAIYIFYSWSRKVFYSATTHRTPLFQLRYGTFVKDSIELPLFNPVLENLQEKLVIFLNSQMYKDSARAILQAYLPDERKWKAICKYMSEFGENSVSHIGKYYVERAEDEIYHPPQEMTNTEMIEVDVMIYQNKIAKQVPLLSCPKGVGHSKGFYIAWYLSDSYFQVELNNDGVFFTNYYCRDIDFFEDVPYIDLSGEDECSPSADGE